VNGTAGGTMSDRDAPHGSTLDRLLGVTADLLRRHGHHAMSMADVASACGIRKASLYHHFPSKDDLVAATLDRVRARFDDEILAPAFDRAAPPRPRLDRLLAATRAYFAVEAGGCLFVNLGCEGLGRDPRFAGRIAGYFDAWSRAWTALAADFGRDAPETIGRDLTADLHGAVVLVQALVDDAPLARFVDRATLRLTAPSPAATA